MRAPLSGEYLPGRGTPFATPRGTVRPYTLLDTPVRRTLKIRFRLLTVAIAGMVVGAIAGYLLLTVTILRWSMP